MSIRSAIAKYFETLIDARFKTDSDGNLIFFPYGFGGGRIVPDAETHRTLRLQSGRMLLAVFLLVFPVTSVAAFFMPSIGRNSLAVFGPAMAIAIATNVYLFYISRHLPRATERLSYLGAVAQSLDRFGIKFLKFGLISSVIFIGVCALTLAIPAARAEADPIILVISILIFTQMAVLYAGAIERRKRLTAQ